MNLKTARKIVKKHCDGRYGPGGSWENHPRPTTLREHARQILPGVPDYADDDLAEAIRLVAYGR